jgi:hypothetical protein
VFRNGGGERERRGPGGNLRIKIPIIINKMKRNGCETFMALTCPTVRGQGNSSTATTISGFEIVAKNFFESLLNVRRFLLNLVSHRYVH